MPLILVVEQEQRYVERIAEALSPQGWEVLGVKDREAAMAHRANDNASLLIVSGEVPDAAELVSAFARRSGGPGAVVLVAENADDGVRRMGADEVLHKPFTDQEIRLAVRRCVVGLPSPEAEPEPEAAEVAAPAAAGERLTSEDLFGDMVSELESVFNFGDGVPAVEEEEAMPVEPVEAAAQDEETDEALAEEAAPALEEEPETEGEEPVEVEVEEEEVVLAAETVEAEEAIGEDEPTEVEEVVAVADTEPEEEELEALAEVEEEIEVVELEDEEVELPEVEEAELEAAEPEEDERAVAAEEATEEVEAAEEQEAAEPEEEAPPPPKRKPRRDPAAVLEERIRRAAEEGKRLAKKPSKGRRRKGKDVGRSTENLLMQALQGIDEEAPKPRRTHRRATEDEVEELVESVVREEEPEAETLEEASDSSDSLVLEVLDKEEHQRDEDEYQTRMRLIWAVILIVALGLLAFFLVRRAGDDATPAEPAPPAIEESQPAATPPEATEGVEGEDATGAAVTGEPTDEEALERELDAQRRQLKEEIAKSRAADEEDGP